MIRYTVRPDEGRKVDTTARAEAELAKLIESESRGWIADAKKRTAKFIAHGRYAEKSGTWSKIKRVYMRLQHFKCAYCERLLESERFGTIEHDVEHFRPKSAVKKWPSAAQSSDRNIDFRFPLGAESAKGYYKLAYHVLNYATACKTCNTPLKSNGFPIAGKRNTGGRSPSALKKEKPFLIYPIDHVDDDPEALIRFVGLNPVPVGTGTHEFNRASVTIRFFELDTREALLRGRAEQIQALWFGWTIATAANSTARQKQGAQAAIDRLLQPSTPHTNCLRSFHRLLVSGDSRAGEIYERVETYLNEQS